MCKGLCSYENDEEIAIFMEFVNDADYFVEKIENVNKAHTSEMVCCSHTGQGMNSYTG